MDDMLSQRIEILRISMLIALVFLHYGAVYGSDISPFRGYVGQSYPVSSVLISYISFFAFAAVPMLSAISGYLFFQKLGRDCAVSDVVRNIRKRVPSLVVPFVLWSSAFVVIAAALTPFLDLDPLARFRADAAASIALTDAVFGLTKPPFAIQFWFIRDLIVSVALSPLAWLLLRKIGVFWIGGLAVCWIVDFDLLVFQRIDTFLFFNVGAYATLYRIDVQALDRYWAPLVAAFLALVLTRTMSPYVLGYAAGDLFHLMTIAMRAIGVAALWACSARLGGSATGAWLNARSQYAFVIYCAHFPLVVAIKHLLAGIWLPETEAALLANYLASVAFTIAIVVFAARMAARWAPTAFVIANGGRSLTVPGRRAGDIGPDRVSRTSVM